MNIVITGSTKGIGKAITETFAPISDQLFLTARTKTDLEQQKKELEQNFPLVTVHIFPADFSNHQDVNNFGAFVLAHVDALDVLVNNAGIFRPGNILDESEENHLEMMSVNLLSVYTLSRILIPMMKAAKMGHVFNICSVASLKAYPNGGSYSISKFALYGLTQNLREELKSSGVKVTAVMPGATWSNSWAGADLPEERLMNAFDIAKSVLSAFQLSPAACVEEIVIRPLKGDL